MLNPYVFIVGCPRSGTTLLQRMLNAHPRIAVMPEAPWIPRFFDKRRGVTQEGFVTPELIPCLLAASEFAELHLDTRQLEKVLGTGESVSYSDYVSGIFDLYGNTQGKAQVGNKTPGFVRRLRTLHTLWPTSRFVHFIRDGRDVYLSTRNRVLRDPKPGVFDRWKDDPATTAALWWELNVRAGRECGVLFGSKLYYEIRYESLVRYPAEECLTLCAFLGLEYHEDMLRFNEGQPTKKTRRPVTSGLRDWRTEMPSEDAERFEAAAGALLDELGYSRSFSHPRLEKVESASKIRDALARDPRTRYGAERKELRVRL